MNSVLSILGNTLRIVKEKIYTLLQKLFIYKFANQRVYADAIICTFCESIYHLRTNIRDASNSVYLFTSHIFHSLAEFMFEVQSKGLLSVRHQFVLESLKRETTLETTWIINVTPLSM